MDVTQLVHWSGKITGIPRVMDELAKRFHKVESGTVIFVSWVKDQREFYAIDYDQTIRRRQGMVYMQPAAEKSMPSLAARVQPTRPDATAFRKVAKRGLTAISRVSPHLAQKLASRARQTSMNSYRPIEFNKDDVLLIPWGEWWDTNFTERVVRVHHEGAKLVQIIHDVGPTLWPNFFEQLKISPTTYNAKIIPIADLVLAVSQNTKKELIGWLKQNKLRVPRIEVFRVGDDLQISQPTKPTDTQFINAGLKGNDFLLCVGTLEAKKNHMLLYYVYKLAKARSIELPELVIVGRRGYHTEATIDIMTADPEVRDKFVFLFNASDEELSWLYDHCIFTVLPSFHEGWGIPIAESLARGVPCLCSNTSSMVEIAEGIVGHFSPASSDECLAAIQAWLNPQSLESARKRTKQYKQFSWDQSFRQVTKHIADLS